jgi:hypothetical protein
MIALMVDTNNNIKIVNITCEDLNNFEGYAPIDPDFNITIFVRNFNESFNKRPLNNIATDIYKSPIFGSVYIMLEPDYKSDDDKSDDDKSDDDKSDDDKSDEVKELTNKYYEVLKNKYD